jgi:hypothetical protein
MYQLEQSCLFSCATTGEGLFEGLQWLSQNVKKRQRNVYPVPVPD